MEQPNIQWFPGHMKKTQRLIRTALSDVDLVAELLDARIPRSSRNPVMKMLIGEKPRIVLLNKSDMADPVQNQRWASQFQKESLRALAVDCRTGRGLDSFYGEAHRCVAQLLARRESKGMAGRNLRVMVVGIPNVGKSTFINKMAGSKRAKVEDRPGVTREKQWVHIGQDVDLLDMPGVLWPKFEDPQTGLHLAYTGAIKDDVFDVESVAMHLLTFLSQTYPQALENRYGECDWRSLEPVERLERLGRKRGMLLRGNEVDTLRASNMLLDEFRGGKLGRITLEHAPNQTDKTEEMDDAV